MSRLWNAVTLSIVLITGVWVGYSQQPLQVLHNQVRSEVSSGEAQLVGPMSPSQQLNVSIMLPLRNEAALDALLKRLYDPSDPSYRKFLSVEQFTEQFGPSVEDYQQVVAFAQANGLTVTGSPVNRLVVPVSGTVAQINQAFNVKLNLYQHPTENRTFYSPDREPSLAVTAQVAHISGLDNFSLPRPLYELQGDSVLANVTGSGPGGSYLGSDMRAAYYGGTTLDGTGQVVGLLEFDGYNKSDVDLTFSNAGQTYGVNLNKVLIDGATGNPVTSGGEGEVVLDIVQAIGMAPGLSQVRVYIGTGTDDANVLNSIATENIAKQISCSWSWRPADPQTDDVFFKEFAAQGQSFFTASGDAGAYDTALNPFFYPQEDDYVTAVGGTHLTTSGAGGSWTSESAWNSSGYGSGGGISPDSIAIPSWQAGIANSFNNGSATLRNVPDVAMEGDFDNYSCSMGSCSVTYAGTSFAAPRWAGFMALINQQAVEAGNAPAGGVGFINPLIYSIGQNTNYSSDFHDVTTGNNDTESQPVWYSAVTGYDLVTGWGSASGQHLIDDIAGPQAPGFWIASSSGTVGVDQGGTANATITVTPAGGFSGSVTLAITSTLPSGVTASWSANPTTGTSVLTFTADSSAVAGTSTVTITGTSDSLSATSNFLLTVHAPTFVLSASPNSLGVNQGSSGTTTITVTPQYGFSGPVNLAVSGLPSGVTASWSTNPTSTNSVLTLSTSSTATPGTFPLTITGTAGSLSATTGVSLAVYGPSFTLSNSGSVNIGVGGTGTSYIYISPQYGFSGNVNLSVSGLPSGVTASFSLNPATNSSVLTFTASSSAAPGTSTITVTGTSGSLTATTTFSLGIHQPSFTLSSSGTVNIGQGGSGTSYVYVNAQYGFTGSVTFSISGLPSGVTALWNPNPASNNSTLTLAATSSAPVGTYTVTITGTSGSVSATTTLTLGVYVPTFTLYGSNSLNIGQGTSSTTYVYVNPEYGFTGSVNLSVSGLPAGATASFSPNPTTGQSVLTLTASSSAATGQYPLIITGTSGSQTASMSFTLGIFVPTFTLSGGSMNIGQGTSGTTYINVNPQYGFTGSVNLSVSGLPSGVTASFSPNPTTGSSTLTLTASSTAALGQYTLIITGTSGTQTATTTVTLGVYVPTFTLYGGSVNIGQGTSGTVFISVYSQYGFSGNINLSVSGLPSGVTASFSPNPTTSGSTLTLTASSTAALGQYTLTVTGTSGTQTATTTVTLGVYVSTFTLYGGGTINAGQGSSGTAYVYVSAQYGFNGNVSLSISGLPTGVTASFSPNPTTFSSMLTLSTSSTTPVGQYPLTVTGTSGTQTATTTVTLGVYAQNFTLYASPTVTMNQGYTGTATISITPQYGFSGAVTLAASGLPAGVTASFSPNPATTGSTLTLTATNTATPGNATVAITGTSGGLSASTTIALTVNSQGFSLSDAPSKVNLTPGSSADSVVIVIPQNGFAGQVNLAVSGLPSGVTASFSPNPAGGSSTLTLTASSSASPGSTTATITGTSGSATATAPLSVSVGNNSATTATLAITSGGSAVTSAPSGSAVTLTAQVNSGSTVLTTGRVNFCDATASYCSDIHLLGSAQLTSAGTAALTIVPAIGFHSYKAVFVGTTGVTASTSAASGLTVTSLIATTTSISQSGSPGNYTLTATVNGVGPLAPSGNVSFLDTTNNNAVLSRGTLQQSGIKPTLSLTNSQTPATGTNPWSEAVGDFNGDGIPDLAVTNLGSNSLTILLGKGDGTFTASPSSPQTGNSPRSVVVGDFNSDGKADLAVANTNDNSLTILLGSGDGTFTPASSNPSTGSGSSPVAIVVGDFNGDGIQDIATANAGNNSVTILLGNGDGTFTPSALTPQTGSDPMAIVAGDFNGDGIQDLAVANYWANSLTILLGNGDGTFVPAVSPSTGVYPSSIAVADFNGDGKLDLAVTSASTNSVKILLGNGDGTFTAGSTTLQTGAEPLSIAAGDFNGDGKVDLATANEYNNTVTVLLGNGDGTFTSWGNPSTGTDPAYLAVGDFNGDGTSDLAAANYQGNTVSILSSQLSQTAGAVVTGISAVGQGTHNVDASYAGDSYYRPSVSTTVQLTGGIAIPGINVTPSATSISITQPLTVTVTVSGGAGAPVATGSVTLTSGSYTSSAVALSSGGATINIPAGALAKGTDTLTVSYAPDAGSASFYSAAQGSASVSVTTAVFSMAATAVTVSRGTPGTATVTVSSANGYAGTISFSCAITASPSGATNLPTCTTNQSVTLSATTTSGAVSVSINSTAASAALDRHPAPFGVRLIQGGGGAVMALLLFLLVPRRQRFRALFVLALAAFLAGGITACGGGSSGSSNSTTPQLGTTQGQYTVTVTGVGNDASATTQSTTFTLTVN